MPFPIGSISSDEPKEQDLREQEEKDRFEKHQKWIKEMSDDKLSKNIVSILADSQTDKYSKQKYFDDLLDNVLKSIEANKDKELVWFRIPDSDNGAVINKSTRVKLLKSIMKLFKGKATFIGFKMITYMKVKAYKYYEITKLYNNYLDKNELWSSKDSFIAIKMNNCQYRYLPTNHGDMSYEMAVNLTQMP